MRRLYPLAGILTAALLLASCMTLDEGAAFAAINAEANGATIDTVEAGRIPEGADLVIANPPYIMDDARRAYRDLLIIAHHSLNSSSELSMSWPPPASLCASLRFWSVEIWSTPISGISCSRFLTRPGPEAERSTTAQFAYSPGYKRTVPSSEN